MSFLRELQERNVVKVAVIYVITGWLVMQVASIVFPQFGIPDWAGRLVTLLIALGFPIALVMAWALELTPEGIKRAETTVGEKRMWTIAVVLVLAAITWYELGGNAARQAAVADKESAPSVEQDSRVSIAVLPFLDLSQDKDQEYFALGMSEELLNVLAKITRLQVASRTSSFAFQGSSESAAEIGKELDVGHVLEGSIRKSGERLRITAQLINTQTDRHLWSETYDRDLADIFKVQDEIAQAIVEALREPLGIDNAEDVVDIPAGTDNIDAYALFLEARELFLKRWVRESITAAERVVEMDPDFARGWELLAAAYTVAPSWVGIERPYLDLAEQAARRAVELDPELALAWAVLGDAARSAEGGFNWATQRKYLERALSLDPKNATVWLWHGLMMSRLGFVDEAEISLRRCVEIDPAYANCQRHIAVNLHVQGRTEEGFAQQLRNLERGFATPDMTIPMLLYLRQGRRTEALLAALDSMVMERVGEPEWFRLVEQRSGHDALRQRVRQRLVAILDSDERPLFWQANFVLAAIGEFDAMTNVGSGFIWSFAQEPGYLESEAFQRHIQELNMPAYWDEYGLPPQCRKVGTRYECKQP